MTTRRPSILVLAAAVGLVAGLVGGAGVALAERPPASANGAQGASSPTVAPLALPPTAPDIGVGSAGRVTIDGGTAATGLGAASAGVGVTAAGVGVATAGSAIAYPYFAGTPGLAPDDTIVVTGVGQAETKADGSDRASAEKAAIAEALADARTQADAIASGTGLSITGTLSVSASISPSYGILPMAASGSGVACPVEPQAKGQPVPEPVCPPAYRPTLAASVTVAYRVTR